MHKFPTFGCMCWTIHQPTMYDMFLLYGPFNEYIYILALPFAASQEAHLVYYHTTHGIKPLVKKWNLLHLELETLKTSLSHAPKNIKRNIFLCFPGIFTSSCERIKMAGLHFICSLFLNCLACHHRHGIVIKSHKKSYGLLNALFL